MVDSFSIITIGFILPSVSMSEERLRKNNSSTSTNLFSMISIKQETNESLLIKCTHIGAYWDRTSFTNSKKKHFVHSWYQNQKKITRTQISEGNSPRSTTTPVSHLAADWWYAWRGEERKHVFVVLFWSMWKRDNDRLRMSLEQVDILVESDHSRGCWWGFNSLLIFFIFTHTYPVKNVTVSHNKWPS